MPKRRPKRSQGSKRKQTIQPANINQSARDGATRPTQVCHAKRKAEKLPRLEAKANKPASEHESIGARRSDAPYPSLPCQSEGRKGRKARSESKQASQRTLINRRATERRALPKSAMPNGKPKSSQDSKRKQTSQPVNMNQSARDGATRPTQVCHAKAKAEKVARLEAKANKPASEH